MLLGCEFVPSPYAHAIQESIQRRRISQVWHLTHISQLKDIFLMGALLSRAQMDRLGILYRMSGYGTDAKAEELKNFIACSVVFPWGMSKEEPKTKALIPLDPKVLLRKGVLFCGMWSSFNKVSLPELLKNCTPEAFDLMFGSAWSPFPAPPPGEFLVPECVPVDEFIPRIHLYDDDTKREVIQSCGSVKLPSGKPAAAAFQFVADSYSFRGRSQP